MPMSNVASVSNQTKIAVWLVLVIFVPLILGLLYGYTDDLRCVPSLREKVQVLETEVPAMQDDLQDMQGDLKEIKTDLKWITQQMGK